LGSFGEKLRKQREQRGIALEAISSTTKISTRMLRALEEENFSQLPGGVFNKGFVRAYARHVGIDEEEAIADYLEALRESQVESQKNTPDFRAPARRPLAAPGSGPRPQNLRDQPIVAHDPPPGQAVVPISEEENHRDQATAHDPDRAHNHPVDKNALLHAEERESNLIDSEFADQSPEDETDNFEPTVAPFDPNSLAATRSERPSFAHIPWGTLAAALIIVFTVVALWNLHRHSRVEPSPVAESSGHQTPAPVAPGQPSTPHASNNVASLKAASRPSLPDKLPATAKRNAAVEHSSISTFTAPSAPAATTTATSSSISGQSKTISTQKPAASSTSAQLFTLLIRADKTSWVSITADGKLVASETLIAPAETSVHASEVVVKTGNAAGVSFLFNGKEIPAQGNDGEVRTYTFDSSGMKVTAAAAPASATNQ
jgi:hypothetical protein